MTETLRIVFRNPVYALLASAVGVTVFSIAIWLPNIKLITTVLTSDTASILEKGMFVFSLYGGIMTNFTFVSALYTIAIAILSGIYTVLFLFYFRQRKAKSSGVVSTGWLGLGGIISGMFGLGCAACGTFLFTSLATTSSASALLLSLPFGGEEFGFLGMGLLAYSVYALLRKITSPMVCKS
jgi:hypothetical protein